MWGELLRMWESARGECGGCGRRYGKVWGEIWKSVLRCGGCGKSLGRCGKVCWGVRGDVKRGVEGVGKCWGRRGKVW